MTEMNSDLPVVQEHGTPIEQVADVLGIPPGDLMRALDVCPAHVALAFGHQPQAGKVRSAAAALGVDQWELREALALAPAPLRTMFDLEPNDPVAQAAAERRMQELVQHFRDAHSGQSQWLEQGRRPAELPGLPVTEVAAGDRLIFILGEPGALPGVVAELAHADRSRQPMVFLDRGAVEQVFHVRAGAEATAQEPAAEPEVPPAYQRVALLAQRMAGAWKLLGSRGFNVPTQSDPTVEDLDKFSAEITELLADIDDAEADAESREQFRDAAVTLARLARGGESPFRVGEVANEVLRLAGETDAA